MIDINPTINSTLYGDFQVPHYINPSVSHGLTVNNTPMVLPVHDVNDDVEVLEFVHYLCERRDIFNSLLGDTSLERELRLVKRHTLSECVEILFQSLRLFEGKFLFGCLCLLGGTFLK